MEAPEKIYVTESMLFMTNPEITLQGNGNKLEYTRTDAFIEKAVNYIAENMKCDGYTFQTKAKFIRDFKNYMKGE